MGTRNGGRGLAILQQPVSNADRQALAKLVDGQGQALADTQQADRERQAAGMNNLAEFGALLVNANRALGQVMRQAADHATP